MRFLLLFGQSQPTLAQNLFLKRISKLKLFVRALNDRVKPVAQQTEIDRNAILEGANLIGIGVTFVEYVTDTSLLILLPGVSRALAVEPVVPQSPD